MAWHSPSWEATCIGAVFNHVVKGFGQDKAGEVYVMASEILGPTGNTGKVLKITAPGS